MQDDLLNHGREVIPLISHLNNVRNRNVKKWVWLLRSTAWPFCSLLLNFRIISINILHCFLLATPTHTSLNHVPHFWHLIQSHYCTVCTEHYSLSQNPHGIFHRCLREWLQSCPKHWYLGVIFFRNGFLIANLLQLQFPLACVCLKYECLVSCLFRHFCHTLSSLVLEL